MLLRQGLGQGRGLDANEEVPRWGVEGACDPDDVVDPRFPLARLDTADNCGVEACCKPKLLLGQFALPASTFDVCTELLRG